MTKWPQMNSLKNYMIFSTTKRNYYSLRSIKREDCFSQNQLKKPICLRNLLLEDIWFKNTKYFYTFGLFFLYNEEKGVYEKKNMVEMITIISLAFNSIKVTIPFLASKNIVNELTTSILAQEGNFENKIDHDWFSFQNGILNTKNMVFQKHSPKFFILRFIPKVYSYEKEPTIFLKFFKDFCDDNLIRALAIRCFLKKLLSHDNFSQNFLYIHGQALTGKSTFINILIYLIGDEQTALTSLKALKTDSFELSFLKNAKLVVLSEIEKSSSTEDLGVLKSLVSSDKIRARKKFSNDSFDFRLIGNLVCHSNFKLDISKDNSLALSRRIRVIKADRYITNTKDMLSMDLSGNWKGLLEGEFVPILQFCLDFDLDFANHFLKNEYNLLSDDKFSNTVTDFIETFLEYEHDSVVFIGAGKNEKKSFDTINLYPKYIEYESSLEKTNTSCTSIELVESIILHYSRSGKIVKYIRREKGMCLLNIKMNFLPVQFQVENTLLSPTAKKLLEEVFLFKKKYMPILSPEEIVDINTNLVATKKNIPKIFLLEATSEGIEYNLNNLKYRTHLANFNHIFFSPLSVLKNYNGLYEDYASLFCGRDIQFKKELNLYFQSNNSLEAIKMVRDYFHLDSSDKLNSNRLKICLRVAKRNLEKFKNICFLGKYTHLGTSPRIKPANYDNSIITLSNVSKITREAVLVYLAENVKNYSPIDIDIVSCYAGIVIGLHENLYPRLKEALNYETNLWGYIKDHDFLGENKVLYNKKFVKICVYATFFNGSRKAYTEGILTEERSTLDLSKEDFAKLPDYPEIVQRATNFSLLMERSVIILEAKKASLALSLHFLKNKMTSASGGELSYTDKSQWPNVFSAYLSSYEFALISGACLYVKSRMPEVIFLHPFHDGLTILCKKGSEENVKTCFDESLKKRCQQLLLKRNIVFEYRIVLFNK